MSFLSYLNPGNDIFTGVAQSSDFEKSLIGQIRFTPGERSARLSFLIPSPITDTGQLLSLLDGLAVQAGSWGATNLLVEVPEKNILFESIRRAGFVVYARQQIYRLSFRNGSGSETGTIWKFATPNDENAIKYLFKSLLPPIVLAAEPLPENGLFGLVYYQNNILRAYAECVFGPAGIYVRPLFHPDVENVAELINALEYSLSPLLRRPVYLVIRSYQAWLESVIYGRHQKTTTGQALMVKRLALTQKVEQMVLHRSVIEETQTEPTVPLVNHVLSDKNRN